MNTMEAWDLIGHEGIFRVKGGRATYEAVSCNLATSRGDKVRLARLEARSDGLHQVNRWVDADTPIEVIEDFDAQPSRPDAA